MQLRSKRIKWPVVLAVGVVLAGAGTAYAVAGGTATPTYRTVTATKGDVEQTLTLAGLVDAAKRADLAFGTDGTVAKVKVTQGDTVKAGQVIATLETQDLDASVTSAVAALAKARAQLVSDEDSQSSSVQNAASKPSGSSGNSGNGGNGGNGQTTSPATAALLKKLKEEQQEVVAAQSTASAALATAADALAAQTAACADAYQPTASSTPSDSASDAATPATDDDKNAACDAALAEVQADQAAVKKAQDDLADALNALGTTLTSALGTVSTSPSSTPSQSSARTSAVTPSSSSSSSSGASTVTAARLASDQAQIDQADADLITARAARAQATLHSTRSGTVASISLAHGDSVTAGTAVAVVVGGKAVTLTGTVAEATVPTLKVGQQARISVPGSSTTTAGTVTAIGLTADTSSGSTTYPVTVTVEDPTIALPTGSRAQVSIILSTVKNVVTLPISAISRNGSSAVVRTWNGTTLSRATVTLGAVGTRTVEIASGVPAGTKVVVADVDQAISGASSELNQRGTFGGPGGGTFTFRNGAGGGGPTISRAN